MRKALVFISFIILVLIFLALQGAARMFNHYLVFEEVEVVVTQDNSFFLMESTYDYEVTYIVDGKTYTSSIQTLTKREIGDKFTAYYSVFDPHDLIEMNLSFVSKIYKNTSYIVAGLAILCLFGFIMIVRNESKK